MEKKNTPSVNLTDIGHRLLDHSKQAEFTAKRGLAAELFPYIFAASRRMSARAIARFLVREQRVRISAVTVTKALNDPKKSWNAFFDDLEPFALVFQKESHTPLASGALRPLPCRNGRQWN